MINGKKNSNLISFFFVRNRAFTYGMPLNRQGLKPIKTQREVWLEHFQAKE